MVHEILVVANAASSYRMQRQLLVYLADCGRPAWMLYMGSDRATCETIKADCAALGHRILTLEPEMAESQELPSMGFGGTLRALIIRLVFACVDCLQPNDVRAARSLWTTMERQIARATSTFRDNGVRCLVCSEDGISSDLTVMTAARRSRLPVVDIPYGNGTSYEIEFDLGAKLDRGELEVPRGLQALLLRWLAPRWVKKGRFAGAVLYRMGVIWAMEAVDVSVRDPWIIHGGMSDVLCAENEVGLAQYRSEGIPEEKLRLTGSPYCDALVAGVEGDRDARAAFRQPRRIAAGTTRVLVSWPPSYHETYPGRSEFADYETMTLEVLSAIAKVPGVEVTVSLHPACDARLHETLSRHGLVPTHDYVVSLIGTHDIFVTYFSSTIRWALAAAKPVVNYDAYDLGLATYDDAPGFVNVKSLAALKDIIERLATSDEVYSELAASQLAAAERWGVLDGRACERILAEIDRLMLPA